MRLIRVALLGLVSLASADSNLTLESRNILPKTFRPPAHFENVNLVRNINIEKSYARETINVVVENVSEEPQSIYYLPFERSMLQRVGGVEVRNKKEPKQDKFAVELGRVERGSPTQYWKVSFPKPLAPKEQLTLSISYHTINSLSPLPAQIAQTDKQYVLFKFSAYAPTAYKTLKQKTKLKLPSVDVPDVVTLPASLNADGKEDPQKEGATFTYGPYGEREAGVVEEVSVRYEFTKPLTHSKLVERDIEVSHWGGNIAFEERHWMTNRAASLKNHFSRVTYQQTAYFNPPTAALKTMRFPLASGSEDAYFIDDIGNVTTSHFRSSPREALLELDPRYPVYGGWNYSFKVGWNGDLNRYLRHSKGSVDNFVLKVPFLGGPKQEEGAEYERVVTRVILPEGASNVRFETDAPLVDNKTGLHRTFMDTVGRTTLTLTAINLIDDFRDRDLVISYDYPSSAQYRKPLTIFGAIVAVFVVSWIVGNLDVSIGKKKQA